MDSIIFIVGPTATGKTDVSCLLARQLKGEVISCDSMLVYKEAGIITSKPSDEMLCMAPHHFIGVVSVKDSYNVYDYYHAAKDKILNLLKKRITVIVCGGSGLYVKALLDGIFEGVGRDEQIRKTLMEKAQELGKEYLFEELKKADEETAGKISPNDLKRIVRALEVFYCGGVPISKRKKEIEGLYGKVPIRVFGFKMDRKRLYERINKRVEEMFTCGALDEVKHLLKLDLSITAGKIIGIKETAEFLKGNCGLEDAKENIKKNTRRFAKRQITWFKPDKRIEWIDVDNLTPEQVKDVIVDKIYERTKYVK